MHVFSSLCQQHPRDKEPQGGAAHPFRCSVSDAGWEQRPELRKDQLQPMESALPQAAAEPHAIGVQGPKALQYPPESRARAAGCVCQNVAGKGFPSLQGVTGTSSLANAQSTHSLCHQHKQNQLGQRLGPLFHYSFHLSLQQCLSRHLGGLSGFCQGHWQCLLARCHLCHQVMSPLLVPLTETGLIFSCPVLLPCGLSPFLPTGLVVFPSSWLLCP